MVTDVTPIPIHLTEEMRDAINGALANGTPVVVAYVDERGQPRLSFRGSTQVFGDDQLAIWVRNPEGGLVRALAANPRITLLYRNPQPRTMLTFEGRGHIDAADATRTAVYERSPEVERNLDPERKGLALIVDLDRVTGITPSGRVLMQRPA
jgi:predicted pyridoxine 5'-phosphate oxidase superfamily flavin-nucleotide-binding protein